jgi:thioredoxin 1
MSIQALTDLTYEDFITKHPVVLVEFWAEWCSYCKLMTPILNEIAIQFQDKLIVTTVNVETETRTSDNLEVKSLPTLILYVDGKVVGRVTGFVPKDQLVNEFLLKLI